MFSKFFSLFSYRKGKFRKQVKKEKAQIYLKKQFTSQKNPYKRSHYSKKYRLNLSFPKHGLISLYIIGILLSGISIIYILKGGYFKIDTIEIYAPDNISDINIAYRAIDSLRGKNIFLANKLDIEQQLINYQSNIISVQITKIVPQKLIIQLYSAPIIAKLKYPSEETFMLTANGVILSPSTTHTLEEKLPLIEFFDSEKNGNDINTYQKVFQASELEDIQNLITSLEKNILGFEIKRLRLYKAHKELHVTTTNNTIFLLSFAKSIDQQINKLAIYYREKSLTKQIYVDMRADNRIFECGYDTEYHCRNNLKYIYDY